MAVGFAGAASAADMPVKAKAASPESNWEATFDEDMRYYSWSASRPFPHTLGILPGKGSQVYAPFALSLTGRPASDWKLEFVTRSGYVSSSQTSIGATGSVSTLTDTTLSGTATYMGFNGLQPYVSLAVNAPTGKSALTGTQPFARMDPDLVGLAMFGEGFNVGPTLGVTVIVNDDFVLGYSVGYTNRGSYNRDGLVNLPTGAAVPGTPPSGISSLSPGDLTTFASNLAYRWNSITFRETNSYVLEQQTQVNGGAFYKAGNRSFISLSATYDWTGEQTKGWSTTVAGNWTHQAKQHVFNTVGFSPLMLEAFNSNSDYWNVTVDHRFKWGIWTFGPTASYFLRDHNAWSPVTLTFVPAKTKWSAGGAAEVVANPKLSFNGRVERMWISEDPNLGAGLPTVSATGWLSSVGATVKF